MSRWKTRSVNHLSNVEILQKNFQCSLLLTARFSTSSSRVSLSTWPIAAFVSSELPRVSLLTRRGTKYKCHVMILTKSALKNSGFKKCILISVNLRWFLFILIVYICFMCLNFVKSIHRRATGLWCNFGLERASERPNKTPFSPPRKHGLHFQRLFLVI